MNVLGTCESYSGTERTPSSLTTKTGNEFGVNLNSKAVQLETIWVTKDCIDSSQFDIIARIIKENPLCDSSMCSA